MIDYRDWHVQLGRRFRALKLWFVLRWYGLEGLRAMVRAHVALAQRFAAWVAADADWELAAPVPLNLVCFRHRGGDAVNQRVARRRQRVRRGLPHPHPARRQADPAPLRRPGAHRGAPRRARPGSCCAPRRAAEVADLPLRPSALPAKALRALRCSLPSPAMRTRPSWMAGRWASWSRRRRRSVARPTVGRRRRSAWGLVTARACASPPASPSRRNMVIARGVDTGEERRYTPLSRRRRRGSRASRAAAASCRSSGRQRLRRSKAALEGAAACRSRVATARRGVLRERRTAAQRRPPRRAGRRSSDRRGEREAASRQRHDRLPYVPVCRRTAHLAPRCAAPRRSGPQRRLDGDRHRAERLRDRTAGLGGLHRLLEGRLVDARHFARRW